MTASTELFSPQDESLPSLELARGEEVLASFRPDLDAARRYERSLLVLTNLRLCILHLRPGGTWETLAPLAGLELRQREQGGIGELGVSSEGRTVANLFYTLAEADSAAEFVGRAAAASSAEAFVSRRHEQALEDAPLEEPAETRLPLLRLLGFARPHARKVALGLALTLFTTFVGLIPPYLTMPLVDRVLIPAQAKAGSTSGLYGDVALYLGGLGLAAVLAWLLAWGQGYVLADVTERVSADLRNRTFAHLQRLSLEYFGGKRTGDLIARISSDTDHLCSFLSDTLIDFITDVLMILGTALVLFSLDPWLAAASLLSFPAIAWLILRIRGRLTHGFLRGGRVWSAMTNILADTIPGVRVVKAFSQERREIERFAQANARIVEVNNRNNALWTFFWPLVALANQAGLLVVWAVGARQVIAHQVTVGVLTAFIAYVGRFYARVESMSRMLTATQRAGASAQRLFEILDRRPSVLESKSPVKIEQVEGALRFERVSFRHGSRLVLDDVSFSLEPGKMLGIVGQTGSGKSTITNLICRFYDVASGRVLLDGVDIRRLALESYRKHIGIVLQDPFLFFGTIAENIRYGEPNAPPAQLIAAARAARAHEFVLRLPEAYDSLVGERGQSLSGGERQRIAIARAVLVGPKILILDEATSAVDVQTEREIQRALDEVARGRTTIAIAHRLSTLKNADRLLVLKDGRLVEQGTREELLALDGEYARLERAQALEGSGELGPPIEAPPAPEPPVRAFPELQPQELRLESDAAGRLFVSSPGVLERTPVVARRCFPLTAPNGFVALLDELGRELGLLESPDALARVSRDALTRALGLSDFLPCIERIESVVHEAARSAWRVRTDRGERAFVVDHEENIRKLEDGRHLITDSHGMRYLVPKLEQLDAKSRRWLARFS